jgi:hypothetical protein
MNRKLQDFTHEKSTYERPNLNRTTYTLPDFSTDGEPPVSIGDGDWRPHEFTMPALRSRRHAFTLAMTALTLGFLLIAMNSPWSKEFLAPGPLSSPHAQLLAGEGADRCAACHGAADASFAQWISGHHSVTSDGQPVQQSALCMKCHDNTMDAQFALHPHGVSAEDLAKASGRDVGGSLVSSLATMAGLSHGNEVACSVCHQEHHGNVSLSQLTDRQCQSCHQNTFASFETGHPEFKSWPQTGRQNIAFDHGSHLNKHFKSANVEFNCNLCHRDNDRQDVQRLVSFEQACGTCHAQQIADSGQSGWTLFELPRLDMAAIEDLKLDVGNWPVAATGDFDGELPPMMRMLLAGDRNLTQVVSQLSEDFSFGDIDIDDDQSVALAVDLVWGIKGLLHDLSQHGQAAVDHRLMEVMGERYSQTVSNELLTGLNPEIFAATAKRWLPEVSDEVQKREAQRLSSKERSSSMFLTAYVKPMRPTQELLADNPLAGGSFESLTPLQSADPESQEGGFDEASVMPADIPAANLGDSELLAENPLKDITSPKSKPAARETTQGTPRSTPAAKPKSAKAAVPQELLLPVEFAGVAVKSGWYRSDRLLKIGYRPVDHADVIVRSWGDCLSRVAHADTNPATSSLFAKMNSSTAAGSCRSCHTLNRTQADDFKFAWSTNRGNDVRAAFTKFSHRPHLTQSSMRECSACHRMNESVSLVGTFDGVDGCDGMSNFHPIVKADCVSCHQKGRTESGCMQCHNYHVGMRH